jgi:hypothetical protein
MSEQRETFYFSGVAKGDFLLFGVDGFALPGAPTPEKLNVPFCGPSKTNRPRMNTDRPENHGSENNLARMLFATERF